MNILLRMNMKKKIEGIKKKFKNRGELWGIIGKSGTIIGNTVSNLET